MTALSEMLSTPKNQEVTKDHFSMTTLSFCAGGAPRTLFIPLKGALGTLFSWLVTENPSREVATKDHCASNPRKGNPPDLKTKVDVSKVEVKGFPKKGGFYKFTTSCDIP